MVNENQGISNTTETQKALEIPENKLVLFIMNATPSGGHKRFYQMWAERGTRQRMKLQKLCRLTFMFMSDK